MAMNLTDHITMLNEMVPNHFYKILLEHGREFTPGVKPKKKGRMKQCYKNATSLVFSAPDKLTYCEGFMSVNGLPLQHAWVTDDTGAAIDPTPLSPELELAYFGIPFNTDYLTTTALETKVYGLLHHSNRKILAEDPATYLGGGGGS
jgi:hypothetical protein